MIKKRKKINKSLQRLIDENHNITPTTIKKIKIESFIRKIKDSRSKFYEFIHYLIQQIYKENKDEITYEDIRFSLRNTFGRTTLSNWINDMKAWGFIIYNKGSLKFTPLFKEVIEKQKVTDAICETKDKTQLK